MLGIKGVGMTSLALVYHRMGNQVIGSDVEKSFITDVVLEKYGISVYQGFDASHIAKDFDLVVASGAHMNEKNIEFTTFQQQNIPVITHAEALGKVMDSFPIRISVCGSHGKTTTSAMLATIFSESQMKGAHQIGVPTFSGIDGGAYNGPDYFIAEADEYANNPHIDNTPRFNYQHPTILLCTNVDFDHPDVYPSLSDVQDAFKKFMATTIEQGGKIVYCADDHSLSSVVEGLQYDQLFSYGLSKSADLVISSVVDNEESTSFNATFRGEDLGKFILHISGQHNILNAAGALLVCVLAELDTAIVRNGLAQFTGSARRFELIFQKNTTYLFDDYAHHPSEIEAVLEAAKHKFPQNRIVLIFQPHTFSRTQAFEKEFTIALEKADKAYCLEVFSSEREDKAEVETNIGKLYTKDDMLKELIQDDLKNTTIITMGAGDVYKLHPEIKEIINKQDL